MIIGVTGRSGSGKSSFSNILKDRGFVVLDADKIVKKLYLNNEILIGKVKKSFSKAFDENFLNIKKLANIVFSDVEKLLVLSKIVNPFVLEVIKLEINKNFNRNIVVDAITLFESGAHLFCDKTVGVFSSDEICVNRIIKRDGISREMAIKRLKCQNKDCFYKEKVNFYCQNNESLNLLEKKAEYVLSLWNINYI